MSEKIILEMINNNSSNSNAILQLKKYINM